MARNTAFWVRSHIFLQVGPVRYISNLWGLQRGARFTRAKTLVCGILELSLDAQIGLFIFLATVGKFIDNSNKGANRYIQYSVVNNWCAGKFATTVYKYRGVGN